MRDRDTKRERETHRGGLDWTYRQTEISHLHGDMQASRTDKGQGNGSNQFQEQLGGINLSYLIIKNFLFIK